MILRHAEAVLVALPGRLAAVLHGGLAEGRPPAGFTHALARGVRIRLRLQQRLGSLRLIEIIFPSVHGVQGEQQPAGLWARFQGQYRGESMCHISQGR